MYIFLVFVFAFVFFSRGEARERGFHLRLVLIINLMDCTQAHVKNPARGHKVEKHHSEGENGRHTLRRKKRRGKDEGLEY